MTYGKTSKSDYAKSGLPKRPTRPRGAAFDREPEREPMPPETPAKGTTPEPNDSDLGPEEDASADG